MIGVVVTLNVLILIFIINLTVLVGRLYDKVRLIAEEVTTEVTVDRELDMSDLHRFLKESK